MASNDIMSGHPRRIRYLHEVSPGKAVETLDNVIEGIIQHMDFNTLKTSREISTRWRKIVTKELQKQVTITLCFDSPERCEILKNYQRGNVQVHFAPDCENHSSNENLIVMRKTDYKNSVEDPKFSVNALCNLVKINPQEFPCSSFKIITKFLNTPSINYVFKTIGDCIRDLNLVLFYFATPNTFEKSNVMEELQELLLNSLPKLEYLRLHSVFPTRWQQEIKNYDLNPSKQFLEHGVNINKDANQNMEKQKLSQLKSISVSGLLPLKFLQGIQRAACNLRNVKVVTSTSISRIPLNPFIMHILNHLAAYRYYLPEQPTRLLVLTFNFTHRAQACRPRIVPLVNQILERNANVLEKITFNSDELFPHIKIPAMKHLKILELVGCGVPQRTVNLHLRNHPEVKNKDRELLSNPWKECGLEVKFPSLESISLEEDFDFVDNFAEFLGLECKGPFYSVHLFLTLCPIGRNLFGGESFEMANLFPHAYVQHYVSLRSFRVGRKYLSWDTNDFPAL